MSNELTATQQAAAFHGLATNRALPLNERLECALQALALYEAETERLRHLVDSFNDPSPTEARSDGQR